MQIRVRGDLNLAKLMMMKKKKKVIEVATHVTRLGIRTKYALNIKTSIQLGLPENQSTSA